MFKRCAWLTMKSAQAFAVSSLKLIQGICQFVFLTVLIILVGCQQQSNTDGKAASLGLAKANFDINQLDEQGLDNGVALDFEFCLANQEALIEEVKRLYPQLQIMSSSRGRIGCKVDSFGQGAQVLVIGSTSVANFRSHFIALAEHPSIVLIERTYWE